MMGEEIWIIDNGFDLSAIAFCVGAVLFAIIAWQCAHRVSRHGGMRWPLMLFFGLLWMEGWVAAILLTIGRLTHGYSAPPNTLYTIALITASVAGVAGVVVGSQLKSCRYGTSSESQTRTPREWPMACGITVLAVSSLAVFLMLNGQFINQLWSVSDLFGDYLVEYRRGVTKYHLVGQAWAGQGAIGDFQSACSLLLGAVVGRRLATPINSIRSGLTALGIMMLAVLLAVADGTRGHLFNLLVVSIAANCGKSNRLIPRRILIMFIPLAFFFIITSLTKFTANNPRGGVGYAKGIVMQSIFRKVCGNACHDMQVAELIETGRLDYGHGAEAINQVLAIVPGPPPERLATILRQTLSQEKQSGTSFWSTTEIGRRLYDGGPIAVAIGFFLSGIAVAWTSRRAGGFWPDPFRGTMMLVIAIVLATSGIIVATTTVGFTLIVSYSVSFFERLTERRRGNNSRERRQPISQASHRI